MNAYFDYLEHGWALTPIKNRTKKPCLKDWTRPVNAIRGSQNADKLNGSAGLLLAHCDPPLMTLDIDDFDATADYLDKRGIDLAALILADDAVQIDSGRPNRAKLVYRLDRPRSTHREIQDGRTLFEFRCADRNGGSVQDVLPPSIHPDTGRSYEWRGDWRSPPSIPPGVLAIWDEILTPVQQSSARDALTNGGLPCTAEELRQTLSALDPNPEPEWWRALAICATTDLPEAKEIARDWSHGSPKHSDREFNKKWAHAEERAMSENRLGYGSLVRMARKVGLPPGIVGTDKPLMQVNSDFAWVRHGGGHPVGGPAPRRGPRDPGRIHVQSQLPYNL